MVRVETYVFLDLETSNLPCYDGNTTKITEISLVAVKRDHVPDLPFGETPRVQHKLTLCLYPRKMISPESTRVTGLSNDLLEKEPTFNLQTFSIIDTFLSALTEPVCLIAHNGHSFDFPILKNNMEKLNVKFAHEILCADSLYSFYDLDILNSKMEELKSFTDVIDFHQPSSSMQTVNESTPKRRKIVRDLPKKVVRRLFYENAEKPEESYKLEQVYRRVLGKHPQGVAHRAENDCIMLLEICMVYGTMFVHWIDQNSTLFSDVKPMTIGVKLGQ